MLLVGSCFFLGGGAFGGEKKGIMVELIFVMRCKVWVQGAALDLGSRSPGTVPGRGYCWGGGGEACASCGFWLGFRTGDVVAVE